LVIPQNASKNPSYAPIEARFYPYGGQTDLNRGLEALVNRNIPSVKFLMQLSFKFELMESITKVTQVAIAYCADASAATFASAGMFIRTLYLVPGSWHRAKYIGQFLNGNLQLAA
jgi:hypothetical protein